jgi:hypothetical protein
MVRILNLKLEIQNWGQACDFAILGSQEFSRLDLARDATTNSKSRTLSVSI